MTKAALYILLFSCTAMIFKPVVPYVSDTLAHIFYKTRHLATVHYENGRFHVHKEAADNEKKNDAAKEKPSSKKDHTAQDPFCSSKKEESQQAVSGNEYIPFITAHLPATHGRLTDPPPKA